MHLRMLWFPKPFQKAQVFRTPWEFGSWELGWERSLLGRGRVGEGYLKRETSAAEAACPFKGPG